MVYLDAHATTPVHPKVYEAMSPYFCTHFGNASSEHSWGWKATMAVNTAKTQIASLLDCQASQVFTTSGATESIHWVVMGWARKNPKGTILTSATEHKATYGALDWATHLGLEVKVLPVTPSGQIDLVELSAHIKDGPTLVTLIHGNNEIGSLNPIAEIAELVSDKDHVQFHVDAAQSVGKIPLSFKDLGLDYLSFSGHKLYAPKGIGALLVKDLKSLSPLFLGGEQQGGMRAGTLNVPSIVGLGAACEWCGSHIEEESSRLMTMRDKMISALLENPRVKLNGHPLKRLPHNINITLQNLSMDRLLLGLPGVAFSASSACSSGTGTPSHVLSAIGLTPEDIRSTVRFGLSFETTEEQVLEITGKIKELLSQ